MFIEICMRCLELWSWTCYLSYNGHQSKIKWLSTQYAHWWRIKIFRIKLRKRHWKLFWGEKVSSIIYLLRSFILVTEYKFANSWSQVCKTHFGCIEIPKEDCTIKYGNFKQTAIGDALSGFHERMESEYECIIFRLNSQCLVLIL